MNNDDRAIVIYATLLARHAGALTEKAMRRCYLDAKIAEHFYRRAELGAAWPRENERVVFEKSEWEANTGTGR